MNGRRPNGKVGIALAGGGPLGAIYEIGALVALEEALRGVSLTNLDVYVGVSAGAIVGAGLANGIAPSEMHAMFILDRSHHDPFEPEILMRPAFGEYAQRLMRMPGLFQAAALAYFGALPTGGLVEWFMRLTRGLPNGLFDNGAFAAYYARITRAGSASPAAPTTSASSRTSCSSSPPTSTAASLCRSERRDSTTCRSPRRSRRVRPCRASILRRASAITIMSTAV